MKPYLKVKTLLSSFSMLERTRGMEGRMQLCAVTGREGGACGFNAAGVRDVHLQAFAAGGGRGETRSRLNLSSVPLAVRPVVFSCFAVVLENEAGVPLLVI